MRVWKYELGGEVSVYSMPKGARVLHVEVQAGTPCLWVLVDPEEPHETRKFLVRGTGEDIPGPANHVGTFLKHPPPSDPDRQTFVFHVFERLAAK
jgi:hypothetical protein